MSSQDRLENVLRDFHVMISKSEVCDTDRIIVSKNAIFDLIDRLNACIYEIMDEYEMTQQSRDRALREHKKEGDKIIWDASRQAEDIYAASVMYTQEALGRLNRVVEEANVTISHLYREFGDSMKQQQETIRENELELKSQLQLLSDTEKYMSLIEERNREIEREEAEKKGRKVVHSSEKAPAIKPEIKINEEYFRKAGIPLEEYIDKEPVKEEEVQPLIDEGVIESSYKKADMADGQKIARNEPAGRESVSQENANGKYTDQENAKNESISQEKADKRTDSSQGYKSQGSIGQEIASQEKTDKKSVSQEYTRQSAIGQEYIDQGSIGQEYVNRDTVDQRYIDQGIVGKEYIDQDVIGQEQENQDVVGREDLERGSVTQIGQEYISQEYADPGNIGYGTTGHEIQVEDFELEEDETSSKEELSFFDRLMGKKKS